MKQTYKDILTIALPAMAENILQMLMGMVDSYLVAGLGIVALSGVSVASNLLAIYQAIFIALAAALSSRLGQALGDKDTGQIGRVAREGITLTLMVSLALGLLAIFGGSFLLALLGTEEAVGQAASLYLALVGGSILFLGLMTSLGAILRSMGRPQLPMYISLLANLLNALFSAIAVYGFHAGVAGVAIGTILSRLIGCLLLWSQLDLPPFKWTWSVDRELIRLALPMTGERLMMRIGDVVVIGLIVGLGTAVVAGNAIGESLTQFNYMPALGIATATVILVAKHRKDLQAVRSIYTASLSLSLCLMGVMAGATYLLGPYLIDLYTQDGQAIAASRTVLLYALLGVPSTAGTLITTALWQGLGNARLPFYATSLGMWLVRIGGAYWLMSQFQLGLAAVCIGTISDNAFRFTFLYWQYRQNQEGPLFARKT